MTDAKVGGDKSPPKRPARPRAKRAEAGHAAEPNAPAPSSAGPARAKSAKAATSPAGTRPRSARSSAAQRSRAATGPGLSDWLSLALTLLLVTAAAALYQWRGEARLNPAPATHSQPASGTR